MRSFVISTFALAAAVALAPSAVFAQQQQQPPAGQPPAGQQPAAPSAPKLTFTTPAGILLVQVKPGNSTCDQSAPAASGAGAASTGQPPAGQSAAPCTPEPYTQIFEEMIGKLKASFTSATAPADVKAQANAWKMYKSSDPGPNGTTLYVMLVDPAVPNGEYQFFEIIQKSLSPEQQRDAATVQMYQRFNSAIAGMNKIDLTPVGGGQ